MQSRGRDEACLELIMSGSPGSGCLTYGLDHPLILIGNIILVHLVSFIVHIAKACLLLPLQCASCLVDARTRRSSRVLDDCTEVSSHVTIQEGARLTVVDHGHADHCITVLAGECECGGNLSEVCEDARLKTALCSHAAQGDWRHERRRIRSLGTGLPRSSPIFEFRSVCSLRSSSCMTHSSIHLVQLRENVHSRPHRRPRCSRVDLIMSSSSCHRRGGNSAEHSIFRLHYLPTSERSAERPHGRSADSAVL